MTEAATVGPGPTGEQCVSTSSSAALPQIPQLDVA